MSLARTSREREQGPVQTLDYCSICRYWSVSHSFRLQGQHWHWQSSWEVYFWSMTSVQRRTKHPYRPQMQAQTPFETTRSSARWCFLFGNWGGTLAWPFSCWRFERILCRAFWDALALSRMLVIPVWTIEWHLFQAWVWISHWPYRKHLCSQRTGPAYGQSLNLPRTLHRAIETRDWWSRERSRFMSLIWNLEDSSRAIQTSWAGQ